MEKSRKCYDPTYAEMCAFLAGPAQILEADKFEVVVAIYWFASDYHGGQASSLYEALCETGYSPSAITRNIHDEPYESKILYHELEAEYVYPAK